MSEIRRQLDDNPERLIDRLVDNELSPAERRELLAALDDEPGGWRRCALAFVEANVWRDALHNIRAEQAVLLPSTDLAKRNCMAGSRGKVRGAYGLAFAASMLVAFACGRYAASRSSTGEMAALSGKAFRGVRSGADTGGSAASKPSPNNEVLNREPADDIYGPAAADWQTVRLNISDAQEGESEAVDVPCLNVTRADLDEADLEQIDQKWLAEEKSAVTAQILQSLENSGHAVTTQMQWWPVEMADGRRVILPVEQVEVRYVGRELY